MQGRILLVKMEIRKLNVGCGKDIKSGWVNLDRHKENGADVIFDLNDIFKGKKMSFKDNTFDYVYCCDVLEDFVDPIPIIDELIRVCKVGRKIEIRVPFDTNISSSLHHKKTFSLRAFQRFPDMPQYGGKPRPIIVKELKYYITKCRNPLIYFYKKFAESLYNLLGRSIVENTFIKYLFPVINLKVVYKKREK